MTPTAPPPDPAEAAVQKVGIAVVPVPRRPWLERWSLLLPALWLVANCADVATPRDLWIDIVLSPCCLVLFVAEKLYYPAAATLILMSLRYAPHWRSRLLAVALIAAGVLLGWNRAYLGGCFNIWRQESSLLARIHAAMQAPPRDSYPHVGDIAVDRSDDPPVRAAVYWQAIHGKCFGAIYDPTGAVLDPAKTRRWLYDSEAWPLYGPWYGFSN